MSRAQRNGARLKRTRRGDPERFVRLALDVLDRRDRDRRGGCALPDSSAPIVASLQMEKDPTGIAAIRRLTGNVPRDPVRERLDADERDLARLAARMGAATPILTRE